MNTHKKIHIYLIVAIVILSVILILLCFLLVREYGRVRTLEDDHRLQASQLIYKGQKPLTADDASNITSWMTFDFINHIFNIPSDYLQSTLQITDASYPNLSLAEYARRHTLDIVTLLKQVQTAVGAYVNSQTTTQ